MKWKRSENVQKTFRKRAYSSVALKTAILASMILAGDPICSRARMNLEEEYPLAGRPSHMKPTANSSRQIYSKIMSRLIRISSPSEVDVLQLLVVGGCPVMFLKLSSSFVANGVDPWHSFPEIICVVKFLTSAFVWCGLDMVWCCVGRIGRGRCN